MTQLLDDLKAVRELLSVPERWTQKMFARNGRGRRARITSGAAKCFCVVGAMIRVTADGGHEMRKAMRPLIEPYDIFTMWNDDPGRTHADVLALLDKAIAAEEGRS